MNNGGCEIGTVAFYFLFVLLVSKDFYLFIYSATQKLSLFYLYLILIFYATKIVG